MSYNAPPEWQHGDYVQAADLQILSDNQKEIYKSLGDYTHFTGFCINEEQGPRGAERENSHITFIHSRRYLLFRSNGEIVDLEYAEEPVALNEDPDVSNGLSVFDLDDVPWLLYGRVFRVIGCSFAGLADSA